MVKPKRAPRCACGAPMARGADQCAACAGGSPDPAPPPAARRWKRDQAAEVQLETVVFGVMKRGYYGTYHRMSPKHLDRYVDEFSGRHNARCLDTLDQMALVARGLLGKRLRYRDLIRPNGRPSGAREMVL